MTPSSHCLVSGTLCRLDRRFIKTLHIKKEKIKPLEAAMFLKGQTPRRNYGVHKIFLLSVLLDRWEEKTCSQLLMGVMLPGGDKRVEQYLVFFNAFF